MTVRRRYPIGAEPRVGGGVEVRVWAPDRKCVIVVGRRAGDPAGYDRAELDPEPGGYHSGTVAFLSPGSLYSFELDGEEELYPDPASRFQPEGPHGPSEVIDPSAFRWSDSAYAGVERRGQVIYELHVGTFTPEGTLRAAEQQLRELADFGVTLIELMPLADFPGEFGWGYDGVDLFAPCHNYGRPEDLRAFVDAAHGLGIGVIVDVVYNHFGPAGNYLAFFSSRYTTDRYECEWGDALNFDGPDSAPVRELVRENAAYWVDEFHMDGLRLDATQSIFDASSTHILSEIAARAREAARGRPILIVAENEPQQTKLVRQRSGGGYGLDALWNDDFHHCAHVAITGCRAAYYTDYLGTPQELISAVKWGYLFQGQRYEWQNKRRGTPAFDLDATNFVTYLEDHDQVANSGRGQRLHELTSRGRLRALTALLLLAPPTPMLFQGQEFGASAPFLYFADHEPETARAVRKGRAAFLAQFPALATPAGRACLADPSDRRTFERCKLDFADRARNSEMYALHRDLLRLRRDDPAFAMQSSERLHGAVLGAEAFCLRFFCDAGDRLLLVNLGADRRLAPSPEPLLAPPEGCRWELYWSSDDVRYGGSGTSSPKGSHAFTLPAHSALVLRPAPRETTEEESPVDSQGESTVDRRQSTARKEHEEEQ